MCLPVINLSQEWLAVEDVMRIIKVRTPHSARAWLRRNHIPPSPACRRLFRSSDVMAVLDGRNHAKLRAINSRFLETKIGEIDEVQSIAV